MLERIDLRGEPLDLDYTFESGQIFRWRKVDGWWVGEIGRTPTMLRTERGSLLWKSAGWVREDDLKRFLSLDVSHVSLIEGRSFDDFTFSILEKYRGLRIIRQDPWECLVTYLISASLSIRAIDHVLGRIAKGSTAHPLEGHSVQSFPTPAEFASQSRPSRGYLGRKWVFLKRAAHDVSSGRLSFESLRSSDYEVAWGSLVVDREHHLLGIGPKVADCVLLFSLEKREAFPMDRWILRGLLSHYPSLLPPGIQSKLRHGKEALTHREYAVVSGIVRAYFGEAGGLVQECLFLHMRTASRRPWA